MPAPASRAQDIVSRLSAAGCAPRVSRRFDHIRIEADVPESLSGTRWQIVLTALAHADRFGHHSDADRHTVWATVYTAEHPRASGPVPEPRETEETDGPEGSPRRQAPPGEWPSAVRS